MKKKYSIYYFLIRICGVALVLALLVSGHIWKKIDAVIEENTTIDYAELGLPLIRIFCDYEAVIAHKGEEVGEKGTLILSSDGEEILYRDGMEISGHGNSTWMADRKSFHIKLNHKVNLLDLGESKHWILLANPYDDTYMRNKILYDLSGRMGLDYVKTTWVNVEINAEYAGVYLLCEKINHMEELGVQDGYLYELSDDNCLWGESKMLDTRQPIRIERPYGMNEYIPDDVIYNRTACIDAFEDAIRDENFSTYYFGRTIRYDEIFDMDSLVKYWLIQEFSFNEEMNKKSTYFYQKSRNSQFIMGPVWDMDWSSGGLNSYTNDTCYWATVYFDSKNQAEQWYKYIVKDDKFLQRAYELYWEYRDELLAIIADGGYIDQNLVYLHKSADLSQKIYCAGDGIVEECSAMKEWYRNRIDWLDEQFASVDTLRASLEHGKKHPAEE